jgi:hypothetical protein
MIERYNGIVGQVPNMDYLLRRNPLWKFVPWLAPKNSLITKMALKEMDERKKLGTEQIDERKDLLSQLLSGHRKTPDRFGELDVFSVAHGAM